MRNRANATTHGGPYQEESLPVLKELSPDRSDILDPEGGLSTSCAIRDVFFDRLSKSDVILVETIRFSTEDRGLLLSPKVCDFIRSTRVTKCLELVTYLDAPPDNHFVDLADAMEANSSILELKVDGVHFHTTTDLLELPNAYRI